ncbi:carbohydrate ABC transporter permease [Paenibacillus sp. FJAT-27812]|uniref:carbohydrate ABC transporter permease n=1 Tax=Paenibacillus sp. FJAT-27812 TaxID=1684143 RepID=UPI0006A7A5F7|nr:sugar ABC transporter permease [Paenibacillus sp. FJAT-27812]
MKRKRNKKAKYFYIFIGPWLIGAILFALYPIIASAYYSFTEYNIVNSPKWIGLGNYEELFHDKIFWLSVKATVKYMLLSIPIQLGLALFFAVLINQKIPFKGFFRTAMYVPSMVSGAAMSLMWLWVFNPKVGLINYMLSWFCVDGPSWLFDEKWALIGIIIMSLWTVGGGMIIFLAGLQGVPQSLYEASDIDGGGRLRSFWHITLPMISPVILFQLIMGMIESFQVFTQAYVMTQGGPNYSTMFYVYYLYQNAFTNSRMGYASAMAWILLLVIMFFTLLVMRMSKKLVHYEGGDGA